MPALPIVRSQVYNTHNNNCYPNKRINKFNLKIFLKKSEFRCNNIKKINRKGNYHKLIMLNKMPF